jgi:hypothetical protein
MPDKSRRSRRNMSLKNKTGTVLREDGQPLVDNSLKTATNVQGRSTYTSSQKLPDISTGTTYLWSEIKWIGIVTLLILILMVVSYFIFK